MVDPSFGRTLSVLGGLALALSSLGCGRTALVVETEASASFDAALVDANVPDAGPRDSAVRDTSVDAAEDAFVADVGRDAIVIDGGPCTTDAQCQDGLFCNGQERCSGGACVSGTMVACPSDACHDGFCDESFGGCGVRLVDRDGDGHVPRGCGGDDCDDANPAVHNGASELCTGGLDEDCNGLADCVDPSCAMDPACRMPTCPDRVLGSGLGTIAMGSTVGAGADTQGSCAPTTMAPEIALQWTAPMTGTYAFDTRTSSFDTVLYLRTGCLGTELGCNDDGGGGTASLVRVPLTAGETIVIFVDGWGSASGNFVLHATLESSAENCTNGVDDDGDGLVDCDDPDCAGTATCCVPGPEICDNGDDDDCDRAVDCADPDCVAAPVCCVPMSEVCNDGRDDDCDGLVDCADPDCMPLPVCCMPTPEVCNDGRDDDCNGLVDCADPACRMSPLCCLPAMESCTNGVDDDCDMLADCADPDCAASPACRTCPDADLGSATGAGVARGTTSGANDLSATCGGTARGPEIAYGWTAPRSATWIMDTMGSTYDSVLYVLSGSCTGMQLACDDDSGGGFTSRLTVTVRAGQHVVIVVDGFNPGTPGSYVLNINHVANEMGSCRDGIDNDADGFIDCVDPDCASDPLCCTPRPEVCNDGIDNDCDRTTDCMDPNCASAPECCMPAMEVCDDFADDDCDGLIDCVDPDCLGRPPC